MLSVVFPDGFGCRGPVLPAMEQLPLQHDFGHQPAARRGGVCGRHSGLRRCQDQSPQSKHQISHSVMLQHHTQFLSSQVVLSACSPYFQRVLLDNPCKHPVLILPVGVGHADLRAIVEFIYRGETYVTRDQLSSIVRVAELLKIKGKPTSAQVFDSAQSF